MVTLKNEEEDWKLVIEFVYVAVSIILGQRILWDDKEEEVKKGPKEDDYFNLRIPEMKRVNDILSKIVEKKHRNIYLYLYTIEEEESPEEERKGIEEDSNEDIEAYEERIQVLERWNIRFNKSGKGRKESLISNTHKKASVVLRTLYSQMKYLPSYQIYKINKMIRSGEHKIRFKLLTKMHDQLERCQHGVTMKEENLTSIISSVSDIKCVVKYKEKLILPKKRSLLSSQRIHSDYLDKEAKTTTEDSRKRTASMPPKFIPKNNQPKRVYDDSAANRSSPYGDLMIPKQRTSIPNSMPAGALMRNSPHPRLQPPTSTKPSTTTTMNPFGNSPHLNPPLSHHTQSSVESTNSDISFQSSTPPIQYAGSFKSQPKKSLRHAFDSPTMNVMQAPPMSSSVPKTAFEGAHPIEKQYSNSVIPQGAFIGEPSKPRTNNPYLNEMSSKKSTSRLKARMTENLSVELGKLVDDSTFQPRIMPSTPLSGDIHSSSSSHQMDGLSLSFENSADAFVPFGEEEDDEGVDGLYKAINSAKRSHRFHNIYGSSNQLGVTLDSTLASLRNIQHKYIRDIAPSFDSLS